MHHIHHHHCRFLPSTLVAGVDVDVVADVVIGLEWLDDVAVVLVGRKCRFVANRHRLYYHSRAHHLQERACLLRRHHLRVRLM